jgi:hypothetical protein
LEESKEIRRGLNHQFASDEFTKFNSEYAAMNVKLKVLMERSLCAVSHFGVWMYGVWVTIVYISWSLVQLANSVLFPV